MPFKDVRDFIAKLEEEGEVQRIDDEIDWNLEAVAMIRRSNELVLPAPFFQKVKGYPEGYRLFGEALSKLRRIAIAMDMDPNASIKELIEEYLKRKRMPIKPVVVNNGPCKENIHIGDEVDLLEFPVPMIHEGDGGRYIGTWHVTICKDLESGWVNWGMYRHMLHNKNTIGIQAGPDRHAMRTYRQSWEPKNRPMEVAIAIGIEPISTFCAATPMPYGVSEVDIIGGIRGEPMDLVKCETVDLEVPAGAEIVIEGELGLCEEIEEGPFGEYTGYMGGHRELRPVIHVKAVTHRNNPILTMGCEGVPMTNSHVIPSVSRAAELLELLRVQGLPVTWVSVFIEAVQMAAVVAIKSGFTHMADQITHAIWASSLGNGTPWIIIVEEDVDPFDLGQVFHALVSKCHPYKGIIRLDHTAGRALHPWLSRHEQKHLLGAKAYFDCTWPRDWDPSEVPKRCSFKNIYPLEVQERVLAVWRKYGY